MAETIAEHPDALRSSEDNTPFTHDVLSLKLDLMHWSRPDESPEEYISRLKRELAGLLRAGKLGSEIFPAETPDEEISGIIHKDLPYLIKPFPPEVQIYLTRISELEEAAGLPTSINTDSPIRERRLP
jgi:hypothetical protein